MVRSSLPLRSPLMTTLFPMFTLSLSEGRVASTRGAAGGGVVTVGVTGVDAGCCTGFADSSRFHMNDSPSRKNSWRQPAEGASRGSQNRQYTGRCDLCLALFCLGVSANARECYD